MEYTDLGLLPNRPGVLSYLAGPRFADKVHGPVITNIGSRPRPYDLGTEWGAAYLEDLGLISLEAPVARALGFGTIYADDPETAFWALHARLQAEGFYPRRENEVGVGTRIHPSAVLGTEDYGLDRKHGLIPNGGYVHVGDRVFIGANTCVDRSVFKEPTFIGDDTRIDNLVHVAHNVRIGKRCMVIAGTVLGGSSVLEDDVFVGMGALIRPGVRIGRGAFIGMGVVVTRDVAPGERLTVGNSPHCGSGVGTGQGNQGALAVSR